MRMAIDTLMVILLPLLMAYSLIGEKAHELIGICMFMLFIAHHAINRNWRKSLFRGRYNAGRVLNTAVDMFLAVFMILQPVSGILMSKHILTSVTIAGASAAIRSVHMTLAYWGFIMMSFHLGLHVRAISARMRIKMNDMTGKTVKTFFIAVAVYGAYAFARRGIGDYLLMRTMFAFFDFNESRLLFLLDYASVMVLMAAIAYLIQMKLAGPQKEIAKQHSDNE